MHIVQLLWGFELSLSIKCFENVIKRMILICIYVSYTSFHENFYAFLKASIMRRQVYDFLMIWRFVILRVRWYAVVKARKFKLMRRFDTPSTFLQKIN